MLSKIFLRGIWSENPVLKLVLGMCPTLAVTTSLENALGMGMASTFVLICSNAVISSIRNLIPEKVRIPCFIVVIATFVTVVDLVMSAFVPDLHRALGIFIPLIVVNCIILGRAEAFASKNPTLLSVVDGLGMGIGFTIALALLGACRELIGNGTLTIWSGLPRLTLPISSPATLLTLAPGGFIMLGLLLASMNHWQAYQARKQGKAIPLPASLDCRTCIICKWGT